MNDYPFGTQGVYNITPPPIALTYFLFGGGQDSTTILLKIIHDKEFRAKHIKGRLLVAMSDTGAEHTHTYKHIQLIIDLCHKHGIEFFFITSSDGYHSVTWQSLEEQYKRTMTIGSAAFPQTCTDNLKVKPCDRFLDAWVQRNYTGAMKQKRAIHKFYEQHGSIRYILGFAKGEEKRTTKGNKFDAKWKQRCVERYFPLIEEGLTRQDCIDFNRMYLQDEVYPSNCDICFYQSDQEVLWLFRNHPDRFAKWVELEKAKLIKWKHLELQEPPKNYGVYGLKTLHQKLERAQKLYGHWTDEQLNEYKNSHGHCIKSKY